MSLLHILLNSLPKERFHQNYTHREEAVELGPPLLILNFLGNHVYDINTLCKQSPIDDVTL